MIRDAGAPAGNVRRSDKVAESVANDIVRRISEHAMQPGDKLPTEATMIVEYGVGRGTLREALRILEVNGLISIKPGPGGGPVVREATADDFGRMAALFFNARSIDLGQLIEARLIMEPVMARLAATRRATGPLLDRLNEIAALDRTNSDEEYAAATHDFHTLVTELSGNGVVSIFAEALATMFHDRVRGILFPAGKARKEILEVHAAIATAIVDGDPDEAERLMFEHMETYVTYVRKRHPALIDEVIDWRR
jgi:DNA-binding FadR family transcriptional regulator